MRRPKHHDITSCTGTHFNLLSRTVAQSGQALATPETGVTAEWRSLNPLPV